MQETAFAAFALHHILQMPGPLEERAGGRQFFHQRLQSGIIQQAGAIGAELATSRRARCSHCTVNDCAAALPNMKRSRLGGFSRPSSHPAKSFLAAAFQATAFQ
jgi:hypothetical protein